MKIACIADTHFTNPIIRDIDNEEASIIYNWCYYSTFKCFEEFIDMCNKRNDIDLVIHLGDVYQAGGKATWNYINCTWSKLKKDKLVTIGNHETMLGHDFLAHQLGVTKNPIIGNSQFNYTFVKNGVRFVGLDTNFNGKGEYGVQSDYALHQEALHWLIDLIDHSPETNVVLFSHVAPHVRFFNEDHFNLSQAKYLEIELNKIMKRQKKNVIWIYGHAHRSKVAFNQLGNIYVLTIPPFVEEEDSKWVVYEVSDGCPNKYKEMVIQYKK